jgi:HEAT repeat protein
MRHRSTLIAVLFFLLFFSFCRISFADGTILPEPYVKLPNIPVQRALLKYRDGVETLIVESTLDGPGQKFGWIIPVPSVPQRFEKITPGLLKTLSFALQPRITHHLTHTRWEARQRSLFAFLFAVWALAMFLKCLSILRKGCSGPWSIIKFDIWLAIIMFVGAPIFIMFVYGFFAAYMSSGSLPEPTSVRVESRQVVGDYELSVLKAGKSSDLNTWLEDNGFSLFPEKAVPIVDDYIAKQWAFVAAKIHREGEGTATPHPILIEFKTDRPVYPMRLTALSGSPVNLELFALASKEAVPVGYDLKKRYCDYFDYKSSYSHYYRFEKENVSSYVARANGNSRRYPDTIGHPIAMKLMWNGCVLTKFAGEISSNQMKEDMFFSLKKVAPYRSHVYSTQWVVQRGLIVAIVIGLFGLQGLCFLYKTRETISVMSFPALLMVCVAIFCAIYLPLEKVEVTSQVTRHDWRFFRTYIEALKADLPDNIDLRDPSSNVEIAHHIVEWKNPLTNRPVIFEDSPGNITWERKYGSVYFTFYYADGTPDVDMNTSDLTVKHAIAALEDINTEIRCKAALALEKRKDLRAVDPLIAALEDQNWLVRIAAASALWKTSEDSRAIESLINSLKHKETAIRERAARELGSIKDQRVIAPLMTALGDEDHNVRWLAEKALGAIELPQVFEGLVAVLKNGNPKMRRSAAVALGYSKDPRAVEALLFALNDVDPHIPRSAARALGEKKDPRAVEALIFALNDVDPNMRSCAAEALGKIRDPRAVEPLIALLKDKIWWVRRSAADALRKLGNPLAAAPLFACLKDDKESVRTSAARALAHMGKTDLLIFALEDGNSLTRQSAAEALKWSKDVGAVDPLLAALKDKNPRVRYYAAEALGKIGEPRAVEPLIAVLEDDAPYVQYTAIKALERLTGEYFGKSPAKWRDWWEHKKRPSWRANTSNF